MFDHHETDSFILSSRCPYSCSLVTFALRVGGILDPEFLMQCQITDKKLEKKINELKQIPLNYEQQQLAAVGYQEELFLDMDALNKKQFFDDWEFKQYNSWVGSEQQWNIMYDFNDDLIVDLI